MKNYLEEYRAYYKARMLRYENNPRYANTYKVEKQMYEAIAQCNEMSEIREQFQKLSNDAAVALTIDEYTFRLAHYQEIKEDVRALSPKRIIEKAPSHQQVSELITMIGEEENKNSIEIAVDSIQPFNSFTHLENIEVYENAEVPEKYKNKYASFAQQEKQKLTEEYQDAEKNLSNWQPGWKFNFNLIAEERHRRLLPYPDDVIKETIEKVKTITNR